MRWKANPDQWLVLFFLLVGCLLRMAGYAISPPGLSHDEVAHWLINNQILAGQHGVYFTDAYGHEAGFHYLQAGFQWLIGDHALALRMPAFFCGILLVSISYALTRRLFGRKVALLAVALLSVNFYPVFYSRQALRAISLPLIAGVSAYGWWQGWETKSGKWGMSAGILAGLSLYTYMAARAVPIFYGLFLLYLLLFHPRQTKERWQFIILFFGAMLLTLTPLALYLFTHPSAEYRLAEVDAPLRSLLTGDLRPVLQNAWACLAMFGWQGDPLWRQNIAHMPVFEPVTALLFYIGLARSLWNWRQAHHAFLLLWFATSAIPSIVTVDAPSSIRFINSLVILGIFPALAIHSFQQLSTVFPYLSTGLGKTSLWWGVNLGLILLWLGQVERTSWAVFQAWHTNEEVQFVWQQAFTEAARFIDQSPSLNTVALAGWTPETMDAPTMELTLRREDVRLVYFAPQRMVVVPVIPWQAGILSTPAALIRPTLLPLDPVLEAQLLRWDILPQTMAQFTLYPIPSNLHPQPQQPLDVVFGGELRLLGYDWRIEDRQQTQLVTYWQVTTEVESPRRFFLHALDSAGTLLAQDDGLESPATYWQPGDLLLYHHQLPLPPQTIGGLRLGVYQPPDGPRLRLTPSTADFVTLPLPQN